MRHSASLLFMASLVLICECQAQLMCLLESGFKSFKMSHEIVIIPHPSWSKVSVALYGKICSHNCLGVL